MPDPAAGITYLDGPRLRLSLLAAADWVDAGRDDLNRINVFPVPDGDTGTNFAMTLRAAAEAVRRLPGAKLPAVTSAMADACVFGARGNSGMLLSQFLLGFRDALGDRETATSVEVAAAIRAGFERLSQSLDEPVEGTILTVCREVAVTAEREAPRTTNLAAFMRTLLDRAEDALRHTPDLLAVLREAKVVDAGAKAFVRLLEGVVRLINGDPIVAAERPPHYAEPSAAELAEVAVDRDFQYCTEVLVRGTDFPASTEIRSALRVLGGSIVVLATAELLKVHVHTDSPEDVFALARAWGAIETTKADDMRVQHSALGEQATKSLGVVVDSSCDLPDDLVDRHGIVVVPLQVLSKDQIYLDRVELGAAELYRRMQDDEEIFTTSQPTPAALAHGFEDARAGADEVLGIFIAGALSGTLSSARTAVRASGLSGITIVDSRTASIGLGMLALRAAELAEAGLPMGAIVQDLERVRRRSGGLFTVDRFDNLLRSGRVSRGRAWLGSLLDIKPILEVSADGRVVPVDRVRGRDALVPRILQHLERRLTPRPDALRFGVVHANAPDAARQVEAELVARFAPRACYVQPVTAALGVHAGPGAWGIFYQVED